MTIVEVGRAAVKDRGPPYCFSMPPAGGGLMARDAMSIPPAGVLHGPADSWYPNDSDANDENMFRAQKLNHGVTPDAKENSGHTNVGKRNGSCTSDNNNIYISSDVLNRLCENVDASQGKFATTDSLPQPVSDNLRRKEASAIASSQENKKFEHGQRKEKEESIVGVNIAGNNAGHYLSEELLPIQYTSLPDGPKFSSTAAPLACVTCGEGIPSQPSGVCKQCMRRCKTSDAKNGTFDELIAYAQSFAKSVKKMLTIKGDPQTVNGRAEKTNYSGISIASEASKKLQRHQSEIARQKENSACIAGVDDKSPRKLLEVNSPALSVCGDEIDTMSVVDGDPPSKDLRGRVESQTSSVTITDCRPPFSRARAKAKTLLSSSRTKTLRSRAGRTRTDSVTSTLSSRVESRRSGVLESTHKSGRTQTFDCSDLHERKDSLCRSRLEVIQEGTPVDPPIHDEKLSDKAHKYAISRSATSPGTPGINKLQREKSNFGSSGPFVRTNTKLTLRANKAAALRKENNQRVTTLFHQQPAIDVSESSPIFRRKRIVGRQHDENKATSEPPASKNPSLNSDDTQTREIGDAFTTSVSSSSKQESKIVPERERPQQTSTEQTTSEIYCGNMTNSTSINIADHVPVENPALVAEQTENGSEIYEKNPYCDDLPHFSKGLENQLLKTAVSENASTLAVTPYFEKPVQKQANDSQTILRSTDEEMSMYTDVAVVKKTHQSNPDKSNSIQWYSLQGATSKSSTQLREVTRVRSSLSDIVTVRNGPMGLGSPHIRKHIKYSETDVDSGTIYHMSKRMASDLKVASQNELVSRSTSNFFEIGGDVSKSSSSTSGHSSAAPEALYTGGFFRDAFDDNEKKEINKSSSVASEHAYFEYEGNSKQEPLEFDLYTGNVFSPSANNLALSGLNDNWKNKSTNNSNRLPSYRCRSRITIAYMNNRRVLNCSNNSNSFVERNRSPSLEGFSPIVRHASSSSYSNYSEYRRPYVKPVVISLPGKIDFSKYDEVGMDATGFFFTSSSKYQTKFDPVYEGQDTGSRNSADSYSKSRHAIPEALSQDLYTPGDRNINGNNNSEVDVGLNCNNNSFGDFYTGEASGRWGASQENRPNQSSTSSGDFTSLPSPKYAPGSFYENAYPEPQPTPPQAQPQRSFFSMFTGYGEPPSSEMQYSPEYAGSFSHGSAMSGRSRSPGSTIYEGYGRPGENYGDVRSGSASPKRQSYDQDGYFDYHSPSSNVDGLDHLDLDRSPVPPVPKIKRVGAIICRENVANKDDYAEDVNRDLMEDPWIPISYRLATEQVKEMGGGRCSKELLKTTEARCDSQLLEASPFAQGHMLEAMGRKAAGWNLKQNTDSLKEDISMKWRDASEKNNRVQQQQQVKNKRNFSENAPSRSSSSYVWRPTDHIPAKARGNRTHVKSEPKGPTLLDKEGANKNNSRPSDPAMGASDASDSRQKMSVSLREQSLKSERNSHPHAREGEVLPSTQAAGAKLIEEQKTPRANRERKRARYPSKAVIQYPKLKLRPAAPPPPPPSEPKLITTVMRGKDTLLISISKEPDLGLMQSDAIDFSKNPFETTRKLSHKESLEREVEAAMAAHQLEPRKLSCFNPPKWVLLEDEVKSWMNPKKEYTDSPGQQEQASTPSNGESDEKNQGIPFPDPDSRKDAGADSVTERRSEAGMDASEQGDETEEGENRPVREASLKDMEEVSVKELPEDANEEQGADEAFLPTSKDAEEGSNASKESIKVDEPDTTEKPIVPIKTFSDAKEDAKAHELINKYLCTPEQSQAVPSKSDKCKETWPPFTPAVDESNRATYLMLSQQLKDAQGLMDMPVRRREKRLWHSPSSL
ncbi:hypothetical protein PoB_001224100 [Plakobranchus ocellatus]|uniref:Uncharacterized protein n=1 Tax=Plakobranchus ocellatus TaxID=259542 RepID=A0AAV3YTQ1_9GAST|nr:hypothetical protein PoB_001224100 [Plakobranchus ocellatus]